MRYFKLKEKAGPHYAHGRSYGPGDIVPSMRDLNKIHPNKFNEVAPPAQREEAPAASAASNKPHAPAGAPAPASTGAAPTEITQVGGKPVKDVTESLGVDLKGIRVFRAGKEHFVFDGDKLISGEKGLTKLKALAFIETYADQ